MNNDISDIDSLIESLAEHLAGRLSVGPTGQADTQLPSRLPSRVYPTDPRPDFQTDARVGIAGIEYTQSIQYDGGSGPSSGSDNAGPFVPLVAYKTMVARIYPSVRRGIFSDTLTGQRVTGQLTLSIGDRVIYRTGPTRADGARLGSVARIDRGSWDREFTLFASSATSISLAPVVFNCPLNFIVPAYYCKPGRIYATVTLWPVADGPASARTVSSTGYLQFLNVPAPKVGLVRVNWVDSAGNVNRPTDAAMLNTIGLGSRMLPFPYFESTILGIEVTSGAAFAALPIKTGGCNSDWLRLVADLNVTRIFTALFGLGDIVFGMVPPAAIPAGSDRINAGCGIGAGAGFVGYDTTFAHEVGHLYGRSHVGVPGDPENDPAYPNYGGSKTSIGEVGIDTGTTPPTLYDPSVGSDDIMSYGNNLWISPYTYRNILDQRALHQSVAVDPRRLRPVLVLDFRVDRAVQGISRVHVRHATRLQAAGPAPSRDANAISPVSLDMLDSNGRVLATHHCAWIPAHGDGCCGCGGSARSVPLEREPWLDFQEAVEWPGGDVASIAFHRGGDAFYALEVGEPPTVSIEGPGRREANLVVSISTSHPRERASVVLLFSCDDGVTWQPVAFDSPNGEVEIAADRLPGGDFCRFRAVATAELQSALADTLPFSLPRTGRRLHLSLPSCECKIAPGPVALRATVDTRTLGAIVPTDMRWSSNLDGELGFGYALTPELREGRHELTVTAPDGLGGTLSERGIIIVGG
jgi:hypothetical protein